MLGVLNVETILVYLNDNKNKDKVEKKTNLALKVKSNNRVLAVHVLTYICFLHYEILD